MTSKLSDKEKLFADLIGTLIFFIFVLFVMMT